jgi:hypothetical protein
MPINERLRREGGMKGDAKVKAISSSRFVRPAVTTKGLAELSFQKLLEYSRARQGRPVKSKAVSDDP